MPASISIHAPAKGATAHMAALARQVAFQSTLPRRERRFMQPYLLGRHLISIHAPAKGATTPIVDSKGNI